MAKSGNRKSRRRQFKASHQKNWLIGRYSVLETLKAGQWPIDRLFVDEAADDSQEALAIADHLQVVYEEVSSDRLTELCNSSHHQGLAARMGPFPYRTPEWLETQLNSVKPGELPPLVVICDRIQDTFNLGAILRSCDAVRVAAVVLGTREQVSVSPQVARSSAGAVNHVPIVRCDDLAKLIVALKEIGLQIATASEKADSDFWSTQLFGPLALIVGSEASGVSEQLRQYSDHNLRIPMLGQVESLNAAVAAGILLYEVRRQQAQVSPG